MKPLLIIKTANGFAAAPFGGELPNLKLSEVSFFAKMDSSYSWAKDGLKGFIETYFGEKAHVDPDPAVVDAEFPTPVAAAPVDEASDGDGFPF